MEPPTTNSTSCSPTANMASSSPTDDGYEALSDILLGDQQTPLLEPRPGDVVKDYLNKYKLPVGNTCYAIDQELKHIRRKARHQAKKGETLTLRDDDVRLWLLILDGRELETVKFYLDRFSKERFYLGLHPHARGFTGEMLDRNDEIIEKNKRIANSCDLMAEHVAGLQTERQSNQRFVMTAVTDGVIGSRAGQALLHHTTFEKLMERYPHLSTWERDLMNKMGKNEAWEVPQLELLQPVTGDLDLPVLPDLLESDGELSSASDDEAEQDEGEGQMEGLETANLGTGSDSSQLSSLTTSSSDNEELSSLSPQEAWDKLVTLY